MTVLPDAAMSPLEAVARLRLSPVNDSMLSRLSPVEIPEATWVDPPSALLPAAIITPPAELELLAPVDIAMLPAAPSSVTPVERRTDPLSLEPASPVVKTTRPGCAVDELVAIETAPLGPDVLSPLWTLTLPPEPAKDEPPTRDKDPPSTIPTCAAPPLMATAPLAPEALEDTPPSMLTLPLL
jgi:hypothetical protein